MEDGNGAIQAIAEGLAGKEGKYVAWRSPKKEGDEGSRDGGAGKAESNLGRDGATEAGCRSRGGLEGGRSEPASRDRSAAVADEFDGVVELGTGSEISNDTFVGRAPESEWPFAWRPGSGVSVRFTASSSMFAFFNSRSIRDELSPVSSSVLASSISSGDMFAIRRWFSSSMLCVSSSFLGAVSFLEGFCEAP